MNTIKAVNNGMTYLQPEMVKLHTSLLVGSAERTLKIIDMFERGERPDPNDRSLAFLESPKFLDAFPACIEAIERLKEFALGKEDLRNFVDRELLRQLRKQLQAIIDTQDRVNNFIKQTLSEESITRRLFPCTQIAADEPAKD